MSECHLICLLPFRIAHRLLVPSTSYSCSNKILHVLPMYSQYTILVCPIPFRTPSFVAIASQNTTSVTNIYLVHHMFCPSLISSSPLLPMSSHNTTSPVHIQSVHVCRPTLLPKSISTPSHLAMSRQNTTSPVHACPGKR